MTHEGLLYDPAVAREAESPEALRERYEDAVAEAVESVDDDALSEAGVSAEATESIRAGDGSTVDVTDAAAAIATADGDDPDALLAEVRDTLLLGMSSAMLDVDRIAADLDGDMEPKEVQGKVEGRHPMTVDEYARIHHYVANANST